MPYDHEPWFTPLTLERFHQLRRLVRNSWTTERALAIYRGYGGGGAVNDVLTMHQLFPYAPSTIQPRATNPERRLQ